MQSQRHRTVIPGKLGPKEKIVSNFSFPTRMSGTATTKSHHAKQNGPDLAGGIGVEAGTCSLGKSAAIILPQRDNDIKISVTKAGPPRSAAPFF
jgi:hypothetical protein